MKEVIFHIGLHRCGSTAVQNLLRHNQPALQAKGLHCLFRPRLQKHAVLSQLFHLYRWHAFWPFPRLQLPKLAAEINRVGPVIISEENLPGPMLGVRNFRHYPTSDRFFGAVASLDAHLDLPVRLVMTIRRQDRLIESLYAFRVTRGYTENFNDFVARLRLDDFYASRYLLAAEKAGLQQQLHISVLEDMSAATVGDMFGLPLDGAPAGNRSLGPDQLNLWRALVLQGVVFPKGKPRQAVVDFLRSISGLPGRQALTAAAKAAGVAISDEQAASALQQAADMESPLFDDHARAALLARYRADNAAFLASPAVLASPGVWDQKTSGTSQ